MDLPCWASGTKERKWGKFISGGGENEGLDGH